MTLHIHRLEGCAPTPLAHYLKGLAVLRLVSEQCDSAARGWWQEESFWLATSLTREGLLRFFLYDYSPTPILSPWNGGSGFFYDDDPALQPLETSVAERLGSFRRGIAAARQMSGPLADSIERVKTTEKAAKAAGRRDDLAVREARAEKDRLKDALLVACRRSWSGGLLEWFDAALALEASGEAAWPALLGSGGNDGRLDFTNNSMQHISALFDVADPQGSPRESAPALLQASLFGQAASGLLKRPAGQFLPGTAGGDNMSVGFSGDSLVNPWDFVLMLEGAIVFSSSISRSGDASDLPQAAAPFAVRSNGTGYASAATADEGPRGEQWVPLWGHPAPYAEVRRLFAEGRTRIGRTTSTQAVDAARAVARLGAARGVSAFQRFGFVERNGQANLAVPLGRWRVRCGVEQALLDDTDQWVSRIRSVARDDRAPRELAFSVRLLEEARLAVCRDGSRRQWQAVLIALGRAERALLSSPGMSGDPERRLAPLPTLRPEWAAATTDGSTEFRLALGLASQDTRLRHEGRDVFLNVRAHWMPLARDRSLRFPHAKRSDARFATDAAGLSHDPDVVCTGNDLVRDCIALLRRRTTIASALARPTLGIVGQAAAEVSLADVGAFLTGSVDDARILALARPLMALDWSRVSERAQLPMERPPIAPVDAAYAVARLTHLSEPLRFPGEMLSVPLDPEPIARLASGDLAGAMAVCLRRLRSSGFAPVVRVFGGDPTHARRLLASLAFPLQRADVMRCLHHVTKPFDPEDHVHGH
jgi:CRISPR-associated protein Csx17